MEHLHTYIRKKGYLFLRFISPIIPDKLYLRLIFFLSNGYKLNIEDPKTFNEKIQWLKLYDHNPIYTKLADKYLVKEYISKIIGGNYIIPTLGVWNNFDEIDFNKLPNQFVLKCNHDSGSVIICKNKELLNKKSTKKKLNKALKFNYYNEGKQRAYKDINPKIIAEKYMVDESGTELKDYKVFCFNGEPKIIQVDYDRFSGHKRNIYDIEWNFLPFEIQYPSNKNHIIKRPTCLNEMIEISKKLSKGIPHVRIDLYIINKKVYFGEITFYHGGGFENFTPKERDYKLGEWIKLPKKSN